MNQQTILQDIKEYLSRFQEEVKIENQNGEFSINTHAENVLLKMLNTAYGINLRSLL